MCDLNENELIWNLRNDLRLKTFETKIVQYRDEICYLLGLKNDVWLFHILKDSRN